MKFKLDECLDVRLAVLFYDAGHDIQTVYQEKLSGAPDEPGTVMTEQDLDRMISVARKCER
ncbi:MAG: DUF5615 family PIN-like protein [Deltaproteobacteria bacterium]|nr:DUF5615 family PIN-like protein [Deltaproteobacteria bacterium]MBW2208474.1 DUF5615 family PIN-like protein [Deltaproteobacteria bacterium]